VNPTASYEVVVEEESRELARVRVELGKLR
jgi:hypothetical protein